jgi:hypothetical protein
MKNKSNKTSNGGGVNNQALFNTNSQVWNSAIGRRAFLKKTGMASVGSLIVIDLLKVDASADPGTGVDDWKKRYWECRLTLAGPRNTAYTAAEIANIVANYVAANGEPFTENPDVPTGGRKVSGPHVTEWNGPAVFNVQKWRDPQPPVAADEIINGSHYVTYRYQYWEEKNAEGGTPD